MSHQIPLLRIAGTAALVGLAFLLALLSVPAEAAVSQTDVGYDLDSPPAPSPARENQLDIYRPDGSSPNDSRPVVVYVHGGGWRNGDKSNKITDKVNLFTGAGYVFVSVNYRLSPDPIDPAYPADRVLFPDHPHDVGEALGWIDRNISGYGGDPTRLLLIGHSAGAHLVSLVSTDPTFIGAYGVEPWQLIGTVPLDGDAYDVADRIAEVGASSKSLFYNAFGTPEENAAGGLWAAASPQLSAGPADPDHLLVTQAGVPRRADDARRLATALGQDPSATVFAAPYDHDGINAAVGSSTDTAGETQAITDFFERMVAAAKEPKIKLRDHPRPKLRPKDGKRKVDARFRFRSSIAGSKFECRLEAKGFHRCSSPKEYRLGKGSYRFRVRAIAPSGRPGETKSFKFQVAQAR